MFQLKFFCLSVCYISKELWLDFMKSITDGPNDLTQMIRFGREVLVKSGIFIFVYTFIYFFHGRDNENEYCNGCLYPRTFTTWWWFAVSERSTYTHSYYGYPSSACPSCMPPSAGWREGQSLSSLVEPQSGMRLRWESVVHSSHPCTHWVQGCCIVSQEHCCFPVLKK